MPLNNSRHNLPLQRDLTDSQGEYVDHFPVTVCSCQGLNNGRPQADCLVCEGFGRVYGTSTRLRGVIAEVAKSEKQLLMAGIVMPGDLLFTPDLMVRNRIRDYDMIHLPYAVPFLGDIVIRGKDKLRYRTMGAVQCATHDPLTGVVTPYTSPEDFTINGRMVEWVAGHGPATGDAYTMTYDAMMDWIVFPQTTTARIARGANLGQKVLLKQRHMFNIDATN